MKKLTLLSALALLAACSHEDMTPSQICSERGLAKGTPAYAHCMVDERQAAKLSNENQTRMKRY